MERRRILDAIRQYRKRFKSAPAIRNVSAIAGVTYGTASEHIQKLIEDKYVDKVFGAHRSIVVTCKGERVPFLPPELAKKPKAKKAAK